MTRLLLLSLLLTLPVGAVAQKKPQDKPPATASAPLAQAEEKVQAGDLDGAIEILRKAPGAGGEIWLRLGQFLERRYDLPGVEGLGLIDG